MDIYVSLKYSDREAGPCPSLIEWLLLHMVVLCSLFPVHLCAVWAAL